MGPQSAQRQDGERGTSLVEVVVTLAIVVTLGSAFASTVRNMAPAYRWEQGTRQVVETLCEARQYAIAKNVNVDVQLTAGQVTAVDRNSGGEILVAALPQGVNLVNADGDPLAPQTVTFTPRSTCNGPSSIRVAGHGAGDSHNITLIWATGRVLVR